MFKAILLACLALTLSAHRHFHDHRHRHHGRNAHSLFSRPLFSFREHNRDMINIPSMFMQHNQLMGTVDTLFNDLKRKMEADLSMPMLTIQQVAVEHPSAVTQVQSLVPEEPKEEIGDIAKCMEILEQIIAEAIQVANEAQNKEWARILPQVVDLIQKTIQDIECFKNATTQDFVKIFMGRYNGQMGDKSQCIIHHIQNAAQDIKNAINDLLAGDLNAATRDFQAAIAVIQDIANC